MKNDSGNLECVVRGEEIRNVAPNVDDLGIGLRPYGIHGRSFDGVNTEVGPVCEVCAPAYIDAKNEASMDPTVRNVRKAVRARLANSSFVQESLREYAERMVGEMLEVLSDTSFEKGQVLELKDFLMRGLTINNDEKDIYGGIDLKGAIQCLMEEERTMNYIKAVFQRLDELAEAKPDQPIELVDAGCGPFAVFALLAALKYPNVRATGIEMNPTAVEMARKVVANFGLNDRVQIVEADATEYVHPEKIDLLVTETAFAGLLQEPLTRILGHFEPQLSAEGVTVPEWVTVDAGLVNETVPVNRRRNPKEFTVGPMEVQRMVRGRFGDLVKFQLSTEQVPEGSYRLALTSRFGLAPGIELSGTDSNITCTVLVPPDREPATKINAGSTSLNVEYDVGALREEVVLSQR